MPATVFGPSAAVSMLNRAFNDISPTFAVYANQVNIAGTTPESIRSFAIRFGEGYAMMSDSVLAGMVLNNMGLLPNTELLVDLVAYFAANPNARGFVVLQIGQILAEQEFATGAMAQYATAAVAWNKEVTSAHAFSARFRSTTKHHHRCPPELHTKKYSGGTASKNGMASTVSLGNQCSRSSAR